MWSECSAKCGGGYRTRIRRCDNPPPQRSRGLDCQGSSVEYELCNIQACSDIKRISEWTPWVPIGNGTERRYKFMCKAPVSDPKFIKITQLKEEERVCHPYGSCYHRSGMYIEIC